MSALKRVVQKELFADNEETLFFVCPIIGKNKKNAKKVFVCLAVTNDKPYKASLYIVSSKEKFSMKKKESIELSKLRKIDGITLQEKYELVLVFVDKTLKIITCSSIDKENFIHNILKIIKNYYSDLKIITENCADPDAPSPNLAKSRHKKTFTADSVISASSENNEDVKKTQNKITDDDNSMIDIIENCNDVLINVDSFMDKLSKEIELLDWSNISAILTSETNACELMSFIDFCLLEIDQLENQLSFYERNLLVILPQIKSLQSSDAFREVKASNIQKLHDYILDVKGKLELSDEQLNLLNDDKFDPPTDQLSIAISNLYMVLKSSLPTGLFELPAIRKKFEFFQMIRTSFCDRFFDYFTTMLNTEMGRMSPEMDVHHKLMFPNHENIYSKFKPYSNVIHALKLLSPPSFYKIQAFYTSASSKVYEKEFHELLEAFVNNNSQKHSKADDTVDDQAKKLLVKFEQFNKIFEFFIFKIISILMNEEVFIVDLFDLSSNPNTKLNTEDEKRVNNVVSYDNVADKFNHSIEICVKSVFSYLETDFFNSISLLLKNEPQLVILIFSVIRNEEIQMSKRKVDGRFSKYVNSLLVQWSLVFKRSFDVYVSDLCKHIVEKRNLKRKDRLLGSITILETFRDQIDAVSANVERKTDLLRSYKQIIMALIESIETNAYEQDKNHPLVVMIENLHYLKNVVNQIKNTYIDTEKKLIKTKYKKAVDELALFWLGKPMEKLSIFFEAVKRKIDEGIRPEDISYQFSFNRQELKKILKEYSAKEVKKGIEAVYKRLVKSIEDHGIIQVVWHEIQWNFVEQFKQFNDLLQKCYSDGVPITMDLSLEDVMTIFSNLN